MIPAPISSFEELHAQFNSQIEAWVRVRIKNREHAEEVIQEVLIKLFHACERYDPTRSITAWIKVLTKNAVIDWIRAQPTSEIAHAFHEDEVMFSQVASREPLPDAWLLAKSDRKILFRAMRTLTKLQKRVLWLRLVRSLSYGEIADSLNVTLDSVKGAMYRAKQIMNRKACLSR